MKLTLTSQVGSALLAVVALAATSFGADFYRVDQASERNFDETVQQLQWAFGGYGLTTVTAVDYQQILKKSKVETGRAAMFEVMRGEWLKIVLQEDPALGMMLPVRVYVFEQPDAKIVVSYQRPGAMLETHEKEVIRAFGRQLDEKFRSLISQATTKPKEQR